MLRITHGIVGATAGALLGWFTGSDILLFALLGVVFGVLPDLDVLLDKAGIMEHRGVLSHSLLSSILIGILVFLAWYLYPSYVPQWAWAAAFLASFLHTVTDSLTYSGTRALFPITPRKFSGSVRYDNIAVNAVLIGICLFALYLILPGLFAIPQEAMGSLPGQL